MAFYRRKGKSDLIAQVESGRRKFAFGSDGKDSARLTVQIPRKFSGLWNYTQLVTEMYRDWPESLGLIIEMPNVADWWWPANNYCGRRRPSVLAVLRLMTRSPDFPARIIARYRRNLVMASYQRVEVFLKYSVNQFFFGCSLPHGSSHPL
jgi:hypothetical protein